MKKAAYKCFHCGKNFCKDQEEVYFISNMVLEYTSLDNMLHWRWIKDNDNYQHMEMWFHKECWLEIAGNFYISKNKGEK